MGPAGVFSVEETLGAQDDRVPLSMRCPHCRMMGQFQTPNGVTTFYYEEFSRAGAGASIRNEMKMKAAVRICPNSSCRGIVFSISQQEIVFASFPPLLLDFDVEGLPSTCAVTLMEAIACHASNAHRATAIMVRRLLEEICAENEAKGKNLHERLESLKSKVTLPTALFDAMKELKLLGNDAAHVDAKDYDSVGKEEAELAIEVAKEIVKALYQLSGLVDRLKARKGT